MLLIGLYTSRVFLNALGVTDYGIYNAVGGIVAMIGFVTASLGNASSRFITIAIGTGDEEFTKKTYGNIKVIYYGLSALILLLGETVGLWFFYTYMNIPLERLHAGFWVYQFSVFSTALGLICVPYTSSIIAHEKMKAFAYISLLDAGLKLLVCYLLYVIAFDRLVVFAALLFCVANISRLAYSIYSKRHFSEVRAKATLYRSQFREILTLSGWSMASDMLYMGYTQGLNILLNIFFGPVVNAARGIVLQVQTALNLFVSNFQTATNPQITKSYALNNLDRMRFLFRFESKLSFFLMNVRKLPITLN